MLKRKKAEEEEAAKVKSSPKKNKVEVLMSSLDSFASGFTSFVANNLVPSGDETEDSNQEQPKDDLSNFWKDLGYNPEGITYIFAKKNYSLQFSDVGGRKRLAFDLKLIEGITHLKIARKVLFL